MGMWIVIAFRNMGKNKRRSMLIGAAICVSTVLLLMASAIGNGSGIQIMRHYKDFWSGDIVAAWKEVKQYSTSDPSRLYYSGFHMKEDKANREALQRLAGFLDARRDRIAMVLHSIKSPGTLDTGAFTAWIAVAGLEPEEYELLDRGRYLVLDEGESPFSREYGVCISRKIADDYGISIGDWPTIDVTTKDGYTNTFDYEVTGIYRNGSEFDGIYVYMSRENALALLDWDPSFSSTIRVFLKDPSESQEFADSLDAYLLESSDVLRAESFGYASHFYSLISVFVKSIFAFFVFFLLFVIALGIRSTVRMNLFERQAEFGTLRAIGFGRASAFAIVFFEIFMLGIAAGGAALALSGVLAIVFGLTGIPTGPGPLASVIGGEFIFPVLYPVDVAVAFFAIAVFSLFASLKPGLRLCYQKITDLLNQDQKALFAVVEFLKRITARHTKGDIL
jgi:ABC-type lipoprotein release transport system permease subunit